MTIESYQQTETQHVPFEAPMYQYGNTMIQLTNPESILEKMDLTFRSMMMDHKGKPYSVGPPLMNELGISAVRGQVQSIVNQTTVMSNFNKNDIPMLMDFLGDTLAKDLMMNRETYGMTFTTRDKVYFVSLTSAFICMKRALDEGEKRFWKNSQHEVRSTVEGTGGGQGPIKRLFGFGKR